MNCQRKLHSHHPQVTQSGFSLIEVLVSIAIGLIILTAISYAYVNTSSLTRQKEDQSQLNDPSRVYMGMLRQDISRAGYIDLLDGLSDQGSNARLIVSPTDKEVNMFIRANNSLGVAAPISRLYNGLTPVFGCSGDMSSDPNAIAKGAPPLVPTCGATPSETRQSLRIAYQAAPIMSDLRVSLKAANTDTGEGLDCLQQGPDSAATVTGASLVINQYFLNQAADGTSQLSCIGSGSDTPQPLASGVVEFVLRYQVAQAGSDLNPVASGGAQGRYLSATDVSNSTNNPLGWAGVTAVEICVLAATDTLSSGPAAMGTTNLQENRPTCERGSDGAFKSDIARTAGDKRLFKRFTRVVALRNAIFSLPY